MWPLLLIPILSFIAISNVDRRLASEFLMDLDNDFLRFHWEAAAGRPVSVAWIRILVLKLTVILVLSTWIVWGPLLTLWYWSERPGRFLLQHPFGIPMLTMSWYEGMKPFHTEDKAYRKMLYTKWFWNHVFVRSGVPTPKVFAVVHDGRIVSGRLPGPHEPAIIKPNFGGMGNGIAAFDAVPATGTFLIQRRIISDPGRHGHDRIFTRRFPDGSIRFMWAQRYRQADASRIATNRAKGATQSLLANPDPAVVADAIRAHGMLRPSVRAVGWDVMTAQGLHYFLEGNVPAALVGPNADGYFEKAREYADMLCQESKKAVCDCNDKQEG
jgi:hypothetical protein